MQKDKIKKISVTAVFSAIAFLITFIFRFDVSFLTFDIKDAIIAVVALIYGPVYGVVSAAVVAFIEFLSVSDTGIYGLLMNFISSGTFAFVCGFTYKIKRNFGGAVLSVVLSVIAVTTVMLAANIFITPFYMGVSRSEVVALIPSMLLPFNLCKSLINAAVLLIIYKPVTVPLKKSGLISGKATGSFLNKKTVLLLAVSAAVLAVSVFYIIKYLGGSFSLF